MVPAPGLPETVLSLAEAAAKSLCQRCHLPGPRPVRLKRSDRLEQPWNRVLLCDSCADMVTGPYRQAYRLLQVYEGGA